MRKILAVFGVGVASTAALALWAAWVANFTLAVVVYGYFFYDSIR